LRGLQKKGVNPDDDESNPALGVLPDLKDPVKRVGIVFRGMRSKNSLTQAKLLNDLVLTNRTFQKIEKGKRSIGKSLAKRIEKEFNIDYRRLL